MENSTNGFPQWGSQAALAARRKTGKRVCLWLTVGLAVTTFLFLATGRMDAFYLSPVGLLSVTILLVGGLSYYSAGPIVYVVSSLLGVLPLLGWVLANKKKRIGVKLIRIPCFTILLVTIASAVFLLFSGTAVYIMVQEPLFFFSVGPGIVMPALILWALGRWNPQF